MDTLGVVESKNIASGVRLADSMMKAADITLIRAGTICSGRYLIYVSGDRDAVEAAVDVARSSSPLKGSFVISNVSGQVLAALQKGELPQEGDAIGVIECRTASSGVAAADSAVKRSAITLLRLVTGQGINGKAYFVISGDVASVEEGVAAAVSALDGNHVDSVVIPRPDASVVSSLTRGVR